MARQLLNRLKRLEESHHARRLRTQEENEPPIWVIRQRMLQDEECRDLINRIEDVDCLRDTTGEEDPEAEEVDRRLELRIVELIEIEKQRMAELGDRYEPDLFWKRYSASGSESE